MTREFSVIGKRLPRPDAIERATGAARYAGDIKLPGMLVGKVLRSPHPHARITRVDTSKAERLEGVAAVMTARDIVPDKPFLSSFQQLPVLPMLGRGTPELADERVFIDKAHCVGDAVAAVAAVNQRVAEEALKLIEVEYEPLPPVFDVAEAVRPDAPRVHDSVPGNIPIHKVSPLSRGDVDRAFTEAACVVEDDFRTTRQRAATIESAKAIASFDATGRLTVWAQGQMPHMAKKHLAYIFDMPEGMVRVITPYVGGSFGGRNGMSPEIICAALARRTGRPVKIEYTQDEDFSVYGSRPEFRYHEKLAFDTSGTLTAVKLKAVADTGAYISKTTTFVSIFMGFSLEGPYLCPNKAGEVDFVYTNRERTAALRGMGYPEAAWGFEQLVDRAAARLGIDPLEMRLKNLKKAGDPSWAGAQLPVQSTALEECIRRGAERIGWKEKRARRDEGAVKRGVGAAVMMYMSGAQPFLVEHSAAFIKINEDGSANLYIHPAEVGQGSLAGLSQIAAEELALDAGDIHVVTGDTDVTLFDTGSYGSRTIYITGNAVLLAARDAKTQLLERAARMLEVEAGELEARDRQIYVRRQPQKRVSIAGVAHDAMYNLSHNPGPIQGKGLFDPMTIAPATQATFAEVAVNTVTGEVKILKIVIAQDCGTVINPNSVEGQLHGGLAQGIGFALYEDPVYDRDTGALTSSNLESYKIASALDIPETELILVEQPDPTGPFGAKGVGESSTICIAPAIANAVYHATGVQVTGLPITPEKILRGLGEG